jgi:hypothetical protein
LTVNISESDFEGPVPTVTVERFDYYLLISWIFVIFVSLEFLIRKSQLTFYMSLYAGRCAQAIRSYREQFFRSNNAASRNLAIDQQEPMPALMERPSSPDSVGPSSADSSAAGTRRRGADRVIVDVDRSVAGGGGGGYNYRPRRNLHTHDD